MKFLRVEGFEVLMFLGIKVSGFKGIEVLRFLCFKESRF
jgi:hypothetical protein